MSLPLEKIKELWAQTRFNRIDGIVQLGMPAEDVAMLAHYSLVRADDGRWYYAGEFDRPVDLGELRHIARRAKDDAAKHLEETLTELEDQVTLEQMVKNKPITTTSAILASRWARHDDTHKSPEKRRHAKALALLKGLFWKQKE